MVGGAARTLFAFAVGWSLVAVLPGAVFRGFLSIAPELAEKTPRFPAEVAVGIGLVFAAAGARSLLRPPASETAWRRGAEGEMSVGRKLESLRLEGLHVVHDVPLPGSRANIDHLVVSPPRRARRRDQGLSRPTRPSKPTTGAVDRWAEQVTAPRPGTPPGGGGSPSARGGRPRPRAGHPRPVFRWDAAPEMEPSQRTRGVAHEPSPSTAGTGSRRGPLRRTGRRRRRGCSVRHRGGPAGERRTH